MRHMTSEERAELEALLTDDSSASRDGSSLNMARSPTKVYTHLTASQSHSTRVDPWNEGWEYDSNYMYGWVDVYGVSDK